MQAQLSEIVRSSFLFYKFVMLLLYPPSSEVVRGNTEVNVAIRLGEAAESNFIYIIFVIC